ncbi:DUF2795 domain-containing protein [Aeromicrobium sp. CTD01-1L150]|uniref:DUF2795 domain-containing protein n=1 Tax=Aeromicrobium sp. CTD01-1L150 TaxID=3341830 RepID=UPI0035BFBBFB
MTVHRLEIVTALLGAFGGPHRALHRDTLVRHAHDRGADPEVVDTLTTLPDRWFRSLDDLWRHLPEVRRV